MTCKGWEERIALWTGGDLDPVAEAGVRTHLAECAACRSFASEMEDTMGRLRAAHREPIAAGYYTAVRARVLDRLARERSPRRMWAWVVGLAAALALAGVLVTSRPAERPRAPLAAVRRPEPPIVEARVPEPVAPAVPSAREAPVARSVPSPRVEVAALEEPLVVRLVTDDPDVVIYWIADRKGEAQ